MADEEGDLGIVDEVETNVDDRVTGEEAEVSAEEPEIEIGFGDEAAPASGESSTIRHLREQIRDRDRRINEMSKTPAPGVEDPGPEPDYGTGEQYAYDEDRWREDWKDWNRRKAKFDQAQASQVSERQRVLDEYAKDEQRYTTQRSALPFKDVEDVESVALGALNQVQQAAVKMGAKNAPQLLYALGRHPGRLAELAKIENPIKLAAEVARLEERLKVMPRRQQGSPEEVPVGSASIALKGADKRLEQLEAEAERTGDRTKVQAYKRGLRAKTA